MGLSYFDNFTRPQNWTNATGAIFIARRAQGWFNNMFEVHNHDKEKGELSWPRWSGGWQGARGWQVNLTNGDIDPKPGFFIENIFEELDYPNEWFHDKENNKLYLWYNNTGSPEQENFVVPILKEIIGIRGTKENPVKNITV